MRRALRIKKNTELEFVRAALYDSDKKIYRYIYLDGSSDSDGVEQDSSLPEQKGEKRAGQEDVRITKTALWGDSISV